ERARGVPEGVTALPADTSGKQLVEDPEIRKQILATYAKANDPVVAVAKIDKTRASLEIPATLPPGRYVIKFFATPERALVGSLPVDVTPPTTTHSTPTPPKKWF